MKSVRPLLLAAGAALLLCVAGLMAQNMHQRGDMDAHFQHMLNMYTQKLGLTSEQQDQIKAVWAKEKPILQPLMQQMRQNHKAMEALDNSGTFDEAKTRAQATQNAQTMINLEVEHARMKSEMMQVLTPDQKTQFQQLQAQHHGPMGEHMPPPPED